MEWYFTVLQKFSVFSGRSRRQEYWTFFVVNLGISIVLGIVDWILGFSRNGGHGLLQGIYGLIVFVPGLAVSVRRLHDTNRSGWWVLVALVPVLGWVVLLVLMALEGTPGPNRFGYNPKEMTY